LRRELTSKITVFDRPRMFVDEMQRGAFHHWHHTHQFAVCEMGTQMTDIVDYAAPYGFLGRFVDTVYLEKYVRQFLVRRNAYIKQVAEGTALVSTP
jgi:ligand-binding SRPBCC domain-containing protein